MVNYPSYPLAINGSCFCLLVSVIKKEGNNISKMLLWSSSFCLMLNCYDTMSFLLCVCVYICVCVCNMIYTEENILFNYNEGRKERKK